MSVVIIIISFIAVLGLLVFFHELGHYLAARRSGITVEEFGMGYPPRVAKLFTYKGTVFTLNALPLGGFARMKGEDAGDMSPGSFNAASARGRAFTLFAGPLMNLILAMALFAISFMVGGSEVLLSFPRVVDAPSAAATDIGLLPGDLLLTAGGAPAQVNAVPDHALVSMWKSEARSPVALEVWRGGQRLTLAPVEPSAVQRFLNSPADYVTTMAARIEGTSPGSPAALAELQPGDRIYTVDDTVITIGSSLADQVRARVGGELTLTVLRGDEFVSEVMVPRENPPAGEGALGVQVGPVSQFASLPFLQAIWRGVTDTLRYIALVLELPVRLIMGTAAPADTQISGPVGIAREVGGAVTSSIEFGVLWPILRLSAVLSAALAITNLLPLPALDGGRLLFIAIEKIRGRRVSPEREGMVHVIGFVLLLSLMVLITVRDIAAPHQTIDWSVILGQ